MGNSRQKFDDYWPAPQVAGNYALDGTPVKLMRMHVSEAWLNSEYGGRPADWIGIGWITPFAYPGGQYYDPCGQKMFKILVSSKITKMIQNA